MRFADVVQILSGYASFTCDRDIPDTAVDILCRSDLATSLKFELQTSLTVGGEHDGWRSQ